MQAITFDIKPWKWPLLKVLGSLNRRMFWGKLSDLRLGQVATPQLPGDDWVRVRTLLAGICGTDLSLIALKNPPDTFERAFVSFPMIPGHESVGIVTERGPGAQDIPEGGRVNVEGALSCITRGIEPPCPACLQGQFAVCWNTTEYPIGPARSIGFSSKLGGAWAEEFIAHRSQLFPVPDGVSDEQAVLVDPLASSLHAVLRRTPRENETVLVFGCGTIGLGLIAALRALRCRNKILAVAKYAFQKEHALRLGADEVWTQANLLDVDLTHQIARTFGVRAHHGFIGKDVLMGGVDLIYDSIGSSHTVNASLRITRTNGTIVLLGMGHPRLVDWDPVTFKQLSIIGTHGRALENWDGRRQHTYEITHELMRDGRLVTDGLLTHTFSLEQYKEALA
ncbi:MAG: alcohol dehydrogenase catalytic domain-containing protein, partial [Phycisphaerae bacterium]|nr:alcohol dehydrogenase catalytic domain-containing protein [Phycisphaerae bacterium]